MVSNKISLKSNYLSLVAAYSMPSHSIVLPCGRVRFALALSIFPFIVAEYALPWQCVVLPCGRVRSALALCSSPFHVAACMRYARALHSSPLWQSTQCSGTE